MNNESTLQIVLAKLEQAQKLLRMAAPPPDMPVKVEALVEESVVEIRKALGIKQWPEPTEEEPDLETLEEWLWEDGGCEASDGCWVEGDGICPHGHPSWLLRLGLI